MMLTHIEHPEDLILEGDLSVIDTLYERGQITMKIDGMSLVWGTNPSNGKFFVCTKAAFNKKKVRLCYNTDDIYQHFGHQEEVSEILGYCLRYLPRTENIYWGDWLGFGRTQIIQCNTLTYIFPETISQKLVIAPHTQVFVKDRMCDAICEPITEYFDRSAIIKWVQPTVDRVYAPATPPKVDKSAIPFLNPKEAKIAKQQINAVIREGEELDDVILTEILGSPQLANLYQMVIEIKEDLIKDLIVYDAPKALLFDEFEVDGEGFVFYAEKGNAVKLVNRWEFSYANFNTSAFR